MNVTPACSLRKFLMVLTIAAVAAGCATTSGTRSAKPARTNIQIEEAVGFTITEDSRVGSGARSDYDEALSHLRQGRQADGIEMLEALVAAAPELTAPRIDLGIAHHQQGDLEAARLHLEQALQTSPSHPLAHNELGIVYRKLGRFDEARQSYETALSIYPGYHFARRNLAVLCDLYLGDLDCALRNYEAYMETVPGDEEASIWIADIRNRLGQREQ